jgi:hypothetical protein
MATVTSKRIGMSTTGPSHPHGLTYHHRSSNPIVSSGTLFLRGEDGDLDLKELMYLAIDSSVSISRIEEESMDGNE